ncbi:MAG: hypothetical protein KDE65_04670 [Burkholderiaceae bacterium]|nr:hypothetical protein [Burkholderiaceae bacterium]MCB1989377.1 hypothetical protein [Burkholderiaceae bacterium]
MTSTPPTRKCARRQRSRTSWRSSTPITSVGPVRSSTPGAFRSARAARTSISSAKT